MPRSLKRVTRRGDVFYFRMAVPALGSVRAGGGKSDVRRCDGGGHRNGRL